MNESLNVNDEDFKSDLNGFKSEDFSDLVENMKTRTVLLGLESQFKKWTEESNIKTSKSNLICNFNRMRTLKFIILIIYTSMIFIEKPFWCYQQTTFTEIDGKKDNECDPDINLLINIFLNEKAYRVAELFFLISLTILLFFLTREKLKRHRLKKHFRYKLMIILVYFMFLACLLDIIIGLIFNYFPFINFVFRSFLIILLNKNLRYEWNKIFHLIWETKKIFFIILFDLFVFSMIGYTLFSENSNFKTFLGSLDSMFILLTNCNFPDIMLDVFSISKFSIIFFCSFIIINVFIFVSLLKALYYTNYLNLNKKKAENFIKKIKKHKYLLDNKKVQDKIIKLNISYNFSKEEYDRLKLLMNLACEVINYNNLKSFILPSQSEEDLILTSKHTLLRYIRMKRFEIVINIINLITISFILITPNIWYYITQSIICAYFILEFIIYVKYYTLKKMLHRKKVRSFFVIINLAEFICLIIVIILDQIDTNLQAINLIRIILQPLIIIRAMRFFLLLNSFPDYKIIFTTLKNMRSIFSVIVASQFSFFLIFSTISMIIVGGKIRNDQHIHNIAIPNYYAYVNFNSFCSSFLTCFSLVMLNNMNLQINALSDPVGDWVKAYFAIFYFIGILIIYNVLQTYILDMYIVTKKAKEAIKVS